MQIRMLDFESRLEQAVAGYWAALERQHTRQKIGGGADRGGRAAVTGGKQMDGFNELIRWFLVENGLPETSILSGSRLELPGFFRPTKKWDMLIIYERHLVAALEFKSQKGPSFGNNYNNRVEEALGIAADLSTAYLQGAFGLKKPRPWLGWLMLLEDSAASSRPVRVFEPHFQIFEEFRETSYRERYELSLRKLRLEKHFDAAALITSTARSGPTGKFSEPAEDLSMKAFLASLAGHVAGYLAAIS